MSAEQGEVISEPDFSKYCRLCAVKSDGGTDIFTAKGVELCLAEKIGRCLPVVIREEDDLPKIICDTCQTKLESCREFFEQIYNATVKLLSILRELETNSHDLSFDDELNRLLRSYAESDDSHNPDPGGRGASHGRIITKQEIFEAEDDLDDLTWSKSPTRRGQKRKTRITGAYKDNLSPEILLREAKSELIIGDSGEINIKEDRDVYTKDEMVEAFDEEEVKAEPAEDDELQTFHSHEAKNFLDRLLDDYEGPTIQIKKKKAPRKRATQEEDSAASSENGEADQDWEGTPKPKKTPTTGKVKKIKMKKEKSTVPKIKKSGKKSKQRFGRGMSCPPLRSCSLCGFKSTSLPENVNHWQKEHPKIDIVYACDWAGCELKTTFVIEIKKHRRQHMIDDKQLEKCPECDKFYPSKYLHSRHILVHQEHKTFDCPECEKKFKSNESLKNHMRTLHGPEDLKYTHVCDLCGRRFTQKANLEAHMRVHSGVKPFSCDQCNKKFSQKGNLDEHRRMHTGEKPFVCDICGSRHTRKGELRKHRSICLGEKKYQCLHCDMKFNRFDGMKRHEQKHSLPKYECDFCGKTFTVEKKLKIHKVIHTEEKPYLCSQCPMKFKRLDAMRTHVRGVHTDERPYPCDECSKSFKSRQKLDIHRRLHTGERPYVCNYCGRGFCESGNLKKHLRVHGKDIPAVIRANNKGKGVEKTEGIDTTYPPGEAYIGHAMNPVIKQVRPRGKGRKQVPPVPLPDSDHDQLKEEEGIVTHDEVKEEDHRASVTSDRGDHRLSGIESNDMDSQDGQMMRLPVRNEDGNNEEEELVSSHPLLHTIQSNWNVYINTTQPNQHPPE